MNNISFNILGSSAGMPQPQRCNAGYVLEIGDCLIQFDCGGGVSSSFRRAGFDPLAVKGIIISHTHADHISDLPLYIQMIHLAGRIKQVRSAMQIHLPGEVLKPMQEYLRSLYLHPEKLFLEYKLLPVPEDGTIELEQVSILPIRNGHLKGNSQFIEEFGWQNRMQCYSYLIKTGGKTILYSADLGSETDLFPYLKDIDLLVVESTHIDIVKLFEKTVKENVGRVILTHFEEDYDVQEALNAANRLGADNVAIAHDGMRIEL